MALRHVEASVAVLVELFDQLDLRQHAAAAARTKCQNNLKQVGLAMHNYESSNGKFPPRGTTLTPAHGWVTLLMPYLEMEPLYRQIRKDVPWYDAANQSAILTQIPLLQCPATINPNRVVTGNTATTTPVPFLGAAIDYAVCGGVWTTVMQNGILPATVSRWGAFVLDYGSRITDLPDGTSNTLMVGEIAGRQDEWHAGTQIFPSTIKADKGRGHPSRTSLRFVATASTARPCPALAR